MEPMLPRVCGDEVLLCLHEYARLTEYDIDFGPAAANQGPDLALAFRQIWGNFITTNNPSIPASVANGASSGNSTSSNAAANWPPFTVYAPYQIDLNQVSLSLFVQVSIPPYIDIVDSCAASDRPVARHSLLAVPHTISPSTANLVCRTTSLWSMPGPGRLAEGTDATSGEASLLSCLNERLNGEWSGGDVMVVSP